MKSVYDVIEENLSDLMRSPARLVVIGDAWFENGEPFLVRRGRSLGAFVSYPVYEIMHGFVASPGEVWKR